MLVIDIEEVEPTLVEFLLLVLRQTIDVWVVFLLEFEVLSDVGTTKALWIGQHVDVELGNQHFHATSGKGIDTLFVLFQIGIVESVMALHAHTIDAQTLGLQVANQTAYGFAFLGTGH